MNKFNPQPLEELKARYPKALEKLYIQLDVASGKRLRPAWNKDNVFDFLDGIRLVISKEQQPDGRLVIHIAGSVTDVLPEAIKQELFHIIDLTDTHIHHIVEHYALVSGNLGALEVVGISNEKIIHLVYRLDN